MKRFLLVAAGLLLCSAAVIAFCYAIYRLGRIGTCASGGPYVSARPCPAGTAETIVLIPGAIVGGLIGLALYSAAGLSSRWRPSPIGLGLYLWSFIFLGASGSLAYAAFGPAATDNGGGAELTAIILLVVFVPMAILPLIAAVGFGRSRGSSTPKAVMTWTGAQQPPVGATDPTLSANPAAAGRPPTPAAPTRPVVPTPPGPASAPSGGDVVARLERLNALRQSGAISQAEFDRLKAEVLDDA